MIVNGSTRSRQEADFKQVLIGIMLLLCFLTQPAQAETFTANGHSYHVVSSETILHGPNKLEEAQNLFRAYTRQAEEAITQCDIHSFNQAIYWLNRVMDEAQDHSWNLVRLHGAMQRQKERLQGQLAANPDDEDIINKAIQRQDRNMSIIDSLSEDWDRFHDTVSQVRSDLMGRFTKHCNSTPNPEGVPYIPSAGTLIPPSSNDEHSSAQDDDDRLDRLARELQRINEANDDQLEDPDVVVDRIRRHLGLPPVADDPDLNGTSLESHRLPQDPSGKPIIDQPLGDPPPQVGKEHGSNHIGQDSHPMVASPSGVMPQSSEGCHERVDQYKQSLRAMVNQGWQAPHPSHKGVFQAKVLYQINRQGGIQNARLVQSSGSQEVDASAMSKVSQLHAQPLPACFDAPYLEVDHIFKLIYR